MLYKINKLSCFVAVIFAMVSHGYGFSYPHTKLADEIIAKNQYLNKDMVYEAVVAFNIVKKKYKNVDSHVMTMVDFTLPSSVKRMYVVDTDSKKVVDILHVAHGSNSGVRMAVRFSNNFQSHQSSLGAFLTGAKYVGKHGLSMRLQGLEPGLNDHAARRDIVVHSAWYMTDAFIKAHHRAGRSWGCFAVAPKELNRLLKLIGHHSFLFAWKHQKLRL